MGSRPTSGSPPLRSDGRALLRQLPSLKLSVPICRLNVGATESVSEVCSKVLEEGPGR